jgi:hypothetical protein
LRLDSIEQLLAELDRLSAAQAAGQLRATGGWTPGQIFDHLARFTEFSYAGFPFRATLPVRAVSRLAKWFAWKRFVDRSLQPGYKLPHRFAALSPDPRAADRPALDRLRTVVSRIARGEPMLAPSPFEGRITHDQWVYVHLRHAELHLSFLDDPNA